MAKKLTAAQDSIPKQTYFSKTAKGNGLYKSGGDSYIEKMGRKPIAKKDSTSNPILNKINSIVGGKKKVAPSVKIDSTKKVTPIGGSKPSFTIKKETTIKPAKPIAKKMPYKPAKKEIIKKLMK
jgi:hypothetical protein